MTSRVVIVSEYFYPTERNDARLITKIAEALSDTNNVEVICTSPLEDDKELNLFKGKIHRLKNLNIKSKNIFLRVFKLLYLTFQLIFKSIFFLKKSDKVFIVTNPVFILPFMALLKKIKKFHVTLLVYDIFPENLIAIKLLKKQSFFYKILKFFYDWSYNSFDDLVVIGRDMEEVIQKKTNDNKNISLIENWCDYKKIIPNNKEENPIIKEYKLENKIVFSFVGNFGLVQNIQNLLDAASLVENDDFILLFIGDGAEKKNIEKFIKKNKKNNVMYVGKYPSNEENIFLNACDVSIISLSDSMYGLGVPSKSYYNMAAAKPLLYVGHKNTEIAKVIDENNNGWVCESSNPKGLAKKIDLICKDKDLFDEIGLKSRNIVIRNYSEEIILEKYRNFY